MEPRFDCTDSIRQFFVRYEEGNGSTDLSFVGETYSETFLFGGPSGHQTVNQEDFIKLVPRMKEFFKSVGLRSAKLRSVKERPLDGLHAIISVEWEMRFDPPHAAPLSETARATYVVRTDPEPRIIFQLDHQDLRQRVQDLGLA